MNNRITGTLLIGILLLVGVSTSVFALGQARAQSTTQQTITNTGAQAADRRIQLHNLLTEHTLLAHVATTTRYDSLPDAPAARQALEKNSILISQELSPLLGISSDTLLPLWREHTQLYLQYTDARKNNDSAKQREVVTKLQAWTVRTAKALNVDDETTRTIQQHLLQHVMGTKAVIDAHASGNHQQEFELSHQAFEHAGMMADAVDTMLSNSSN